MWGLRQRMAEQTVLGRLIADAVFCCTGAEPGSEAGMEQVLHVPCCGQGADGVKEVGCISMPRQAGARRAMTLLCAWGLPPLGWLLGCFRLFGGDCCVL